jgi:hypothetical protein
LQRRGHEENEGGLQESVGDAIKTVSDSKGHIILVY